jgi:hypothetical protein
LNWVVGGPIRAAEVKTGDPPGTRRLGARGHLPCGTQAIVTGRSPANPVTVPRYRPSNTVCGYRGVPPPAGRAG